MKQHAAAESSCGVACHAGEGVVVVVGAVGVVVVAVVVGAVVLAAAGGGVNDAGVFPTTEACPTPAGRAWPAAYRPHPVQTVASRPSANHRPGLRGSRGMATWLVRMRTRGARASRAQTAGSTRARRAAVAAAVGVVAGVVIEAAAVVAAALRLGRPSLVAVRPANLS